MKYAFFQGCNIPVRIPQYARATERVLHALGVELKEMRDFNCCGYPMRNVDEKAYLLPSVRNLALAERAGLDILVMCNCCFHSLKRVEAVLHNDAALTAEFNSMLEKEGLGYTGQTQVKHYLTVLHEDIGLAVIKEKLIHRFSGLKTAVILGCHLLRPREITQFDNSFVPGITARLMELIGATSVDWQGQLECCGAALAGFNDEVSSQLLREKLIGARNTGADYITPICSYCYLQFDAGQQQNLAAETAPPLPVILYPQLLGLCLGLEATALGIGENQTISEANLTGLPALLGPPTEEKKQKRRKKMEEAA
ncbi:MAG: CoB--CoM heterodisulfide reductase iron-sulfur subunit B family protein [Desulfopila sp.]